MPNQSGKIILVLILLLLILGGAIYFFLPVFKKQQYIEQVINYLPQPSVQPQDANTSAEMKNYQSENFNISIKVPNIAQIEEKSSIIYINLPNGRLSIIKNGTNYEDIKLYYADLKNKNSLNPLSYAEGKINKYSYVVTTDEGAKEKSRVEKTYFLYSNNRVFSISTSDEALYPILDQIVESFEYKP